MKPGDMLIYRGDVVEHWREPLWGNNHAQVFLHYNEKDGKYHMPFDARPMLGLPGGFRGFGQVEKQSNSIDAGWEPEPYDFKEFDVID